MKILVVHQYYLLPGQPGGSRFNEMCRLWVEAGHEVYVIAGMLNYVTGETPKQYKRRWITRETDGGVRVYRCHVPSSYHSGRLGRMWAFLGFTISACVAALRIESPDVVIATSPPLVAALPGWVAARLRFRRSAYILEIRDLWPESWVMMGTIDRNSFAARIMYALERWACSTADCINVLTPAFRENILQRGLAGENKIVLVPNGADVNAFEPSVRDNEIRKELGWDDRTVALYAGAHGIPNALMQLVDSAERLRDRPDILIACVGDGIERKELQAASKSRGLSNIVFHGPQPKERMPDVVNACDICVAVLQNNPTFRTVYPNKVFDYMACARPILLAIDGVARDLVCDQARAGIFVEPENPEAIASAIRMLADDPDLRCKLGRSGREWVLANATRDALAKKYISVMQSLLSRTGEVRC